MVTKEQIKELIKSYVLRTFQFIFFWLPVRKNRVMVYVHGRKGFTCNPKYIVRGLKRRYGDQLDIIWLTLYPETCAEVSALGVTVMVANSRQSIRAYLKTRVYVTNDAFPSWALRRPNQRWINTWHGGMNYKHIGYDFLPPMNVCERRLFRIKNREPDVYLSGSHFFSENTSSSFRIKPTVFAPTGLPRNDLFFESDPELEKKLRKKIGVADTAKIVLYAPTFRKELKPGTHGMNFKQLLRALGKRFGGEWVVLFRNHCFVDGQKGEQEAETMIDASDYPDMQELLFVSDILISDYSSCMWDFCLTKRPCLVFAPDLKEYIKSDRGFAYPPEKWPFPIAQTMKQLEENILACDPKQCAERASTHLSDMGSYDRGDASQRATEIIGRFCEITKGYKKNEYRNTGK